MVLRQAFNMLTRIHSRAATLKRLGTIDITTPIRITPSNYFRFIDGPSQTTIQSREFVIPIDSILGYPVEIISITGVLTDGTFKLGNDAGDTGDLAFDVLLADIQTAIRVIPGFANVTVTETVATGLRTLRIVYVGVGTQDPLTFLDNSLVGDTDTSAEFNGEHVAWSPLLKRGDRIIDPILNETLTLDEIVEIPDLGGGLMGFRVRVQ